MGQGSKLGEAVGRDQGKWGMLGEYEGPALERCMMDHEIQLQRAGLNLLE